jgi:NAD+ kinase
MPKRRFTRVVLYARQHRVNPFVNETLQRLVDFLKSRQVDTYFDAESAAHMAIDLPVLPLDAMDSQQDLILVVGGDGSLISAGRMAIHVDVPVTGISRGRLGFLTDISPDDMETQVEAILNGHFIEEKRFLLQARVYQDGQICFQGDCLNDVVLSRGNETHLIEFDVYIDNQFVSHYRSDGLILSTPTGSTAYALSAGGPIMHPELDAVVIVPMFSHSLSSRPLVFHGDCVVEICIRKSNEQDLQLSCDGHESTLIKPGQRIVVQKIPQQLRLLHPCEYHYYDTLRMKLGWGVKPEM